MLSNLLKLVIKEVLKRACKTIDIKIINIKLNQKRFINEIIIEAENIIFQELYLNKIQILISNLNLRKINYRNILDLNNFHNKLTIKIEKT